MKGVQVRVGERIVTKLNFWAMFDDDPDDLRGPFVSAQEAQAWIDEAPNIAPLFKIVGTTTQVHLIERD